MNHKNITPQKFEAIQYDTQNAYTVHIWPKYFERENFHGF